MIPRQFPYRLLVRSPCHLPLHFLTSLSSLADMAYLGLLTHPHLLAYLRYLVLYLDSYPLWQAFPRPLLYLIIASMVTKP